MTPLAASISDATIWRVTFDDTRSVNYDRNSFIIQATGLLKNTFLFVKTFVLVVNLLEWNYIL